jgi:hypothetical protein
MIEVAESDKVFQAIHECLDTYRPGRSLLLHIAQYVERLRATPGWTMDQVASVDRAVRHILTSLRDTGQFPSTIAAPPRRRRRYATAGRRNAARVLQIAG